MEIKCSLFTYFTIFSLFIDSLVIYQSFWRCVRQTNPAFFESFYVSIAENRQEFEK